jgi:hypothetical protein
MSGIYHVTGAKLAIQVIYRKGLSCAENLWLKGLGDDLGAEEFSRILAEVESKAGVLSAYMDTVINANSGIMKELMGMKTGPAMRKVLEEAGWIQEWMAQGRDEARAEFSQEIERLKRENAALKSAARSKI